MRKPEAIAKAQTLFGRDGAADRVHWKDGYEWLVGYRMGGGWMWIGRSRISYADAFAKAIKRGNE